MTRDACSGTCGEMDHASGPWMSERVRCELSERWSEDETVAAKRLAEVVRRAPSPMVLCCSYGARPCALAQVLPRASTSGAADSRLSSTARRRSLSTVHGVAAACFASASCALRRASLASAASARRRGRSLCASASEPPAGPSEPLPISVAGARNKAEAGDDGFARSMWWTGGHTRLHPPAPGEKPSVRWTLHESDPSLNQSLISEGTTISQLFDQGASHCTTSSSLVTLLSL